MQIDIAPKKKWRLKKERLKNNNRQLLSNLIEQLLKDRGVVEHDELRSFFYPDYEIDTHDPYLYNHMGRAVERVFKAIDNSEPVVIFGDYDADGVTSSTLLYKTLNKLGAVVHEVYIPHREKEGYGLNEEAVSKFIQNQVKLLITVDCGITNINEINLANNGNLDVIVTDHHHAPETLPNAFAILNAKVEDDKYPFPHLAGVGVSFKLAQALLQEQSRRSPNEADELKKFEKWLLDLVAIATVTDLVPLIDENRTLLKYGLMVLNRTKRPGLIALIEKLGKPETITADTIAFQIGPRLNAPGRMDHANLAFRLLATEDETEARMLAEELELLNRQRQSITEKMTAEAEDSLLSRDSRVAVAIGKNWPAGLVGLVASRITEKMHRPTLVITEGEHGVVGSGRSIASFNIIEAMHMVPDGVFLKFGGHAQACGFTLVDVEAAKKLQTSLHEQVLQALSDVDLQPTLEIETDINLHEVNWNLVKSLELFEPFGVENIRPIFLVKKVCLGNVAAVGVNAKHLKITVTDNNGVVRHGIGFGLAKQFEELKIGDTIDLVAEISVNKWNGKEDIQLRIFDIRKSI